MPATLTAPRPAAQTSIPASERPSLALLAQVTSSTARAVALYASDMPTNYRASMDDATRIIGWIIQGTERLSLETVGHDGASLRAFNLLMIEDTDGPTDRAAYAHRFPLARRIDKAQSAAATLALLSLDVPGRTRPARQAA